MTITVLGDGSRGGSYVLGITLSKREAVRFGRFAGGQVFDLAPGGYVYIGSALGRRGWPLARRLLRHASRSGKQPPHSIRADLHQALVDCDAAGPDVSAPGRKLLRWHADYLLDLPSAEITRIVALQSSQSHEAGIADYLASLPDTTEIAPGLGASDRHGTTHLLTAPDADAWWDALTHALADLIYAMH